MISISWANEREGSNSLRFSSSFFESIAIDSIAYCSKPQGRRKFNN